MAGKADLKVAVLGNEASGKTALLERFVHERFEHNLSTVSIMIKERRCGLLHNYTRVRVQGAQHRLVR